MTILPFAGTFVLVLPLALSAQVRMNSPALGYVFDGSERAVRAVSGIPGASSLAAPVSAPEKMSAVFIAPAGRWGIAELVDEPGVAAVDWREGAMRNRRFDAMTSVSAAAFSGGGVALYSAASGRIQFWTGLPDRPALAWETSCEGVRALAAQGQSVAVANEHGIEVLDGTAPPRQVASGEFTGLAFTADGLIAADAGLSRLVRVAMHSGEIAEVAGPPQGLDRPTGLAVSTDGVAGAVLQTDSVVLMELGGARIDKIPLAARGTDIRALDASGVFLVRCEDGTHWVIHRSAAGEAQAVFAGGVR